jgi:hypothetical protein
MTERIAVEAIPDRPRRPTLSAVPPAGLAAAAAAVEAQTAQMASAAIASMPSSHQSQVNAALTAAFRSIARVLAVRLQLLLSLIADFVLAILAMQWQTPAGLYVLIAFCALTTAPLVWLEFSGRPRG